MAMPIVVVDFTPVRTLFEQNQLVGLLTALQCFDALRKQHIRGVFWNWLRLRICRLS